MTETARQPFIQNTSEEADRVAITYYTDPLCCWSWALEPQWRRLQKEYGLHLTWKYVMGGLIPDWKTYYDPEHSVSKAVQMGPVWMHAAQISGMPMNNRIWVGEPPASSYPACIAFKCAERQSSYAAEIYLRLLREAVMIAGKDIAKKTVLLEVAQHLPAYFPGFDLAAFENDLVSDSGIDAFRSDLMDCQQKRIERFPTLLFRYQSQAIILKGYYPYKQVSAIIEKIAPHIEPEKDNGNFANWWVLTEREKQELSQ